MTEQEAIEVLKQPCYCDYDLSATIENCEVSSCDKRDAIRMAIKALEEIQQYRALGTVEELRVARDKQIPKKPIKDEFDRYICPDCGWIVYKDEFGGRYLPHCENCGQKIDWSDEDDNS